MTTTSGKDAGKFKVDKTVDCIGLYCPVPILKTREEIEELTSGQILEILADDPAVEEDISRWSKRTGNEIVCLERRDSVLRILVRKK
ncbi:MAG: sulfurtransferase TusA family protein [Methanomassiliicoccales archaeon]|jgi:TusA-related sulfurtransferase|nr:sulfurtransferase TusA family protein [Methanomassiliicoccales archaeon]